MKKTKKPRAPQIPQTDRPTPAQPDQTNWGGTAFREYVTRLSQYFVERMFLGGYRTLVEYRETITDAQDGGNQEILACVRADHAYMNIKIEVAKGLWDRYNKAAYDEVAEVICHEFCHVVHSVLYDWAEQTVSPVDRSTWVGDKERVATWMSRVVMSLVPRSVWGEERQ